MFYSQKDPRWANFPLGTSKDTIGQSGCKITSLGNMLGITPDEVDDIMVDQNAYVGFCLSEDRSTAKALGLNYLGRTIDEPNGVCIAETDAFVNFGVKQHFFLFDKGMIVDPLDNNPDWRQNTYHIVSYRLFSLKQPKMNTNLIEDNINLLKDLWPLQTDENKNAVHYMADKMRDLQKTMGLSITK